VTNYPNDPNQPGGYGEQQPGNGSGDQPSGNPPQGGPQYGAPGQGGQQYGGQPYPGQQPYSSPQYGAPQQNNPYTGPPAPAGDHQRATLIMILGILSIPCCGLFTGIPAIIMGRMALQEIDSSGGAISGRGKVNAGFICGIIGTVLSVVGIIVRLAAH
jgi:hypothetical protein